MAKKSKWNIKHPDAIEMHRDFYEKDFEVIQMEVIGFMGHSLIQMLGEGGSNFGGFSGLLSTDGDKVVFTKGGLFKDGKITKKWEISKTDIVSIKHGPFKTKIEFKDKHKGLSSPNAWELTARIMMVGIGLITLRRKRVIIGTSNSFDNLEKFSALLDK
jgi:hypothetical protein